jgi:hypothetical protein
MNNLPVINSHNSWSPLEEVWLGDVYPASWYEHLRPEIRDVFQRLTDITKEDLTTIDKTLTAMGIKVQRPRYDEIENYLDEKENLVKPAICPRDNNVVIGNTLYRVDLAGGDPWQLVISQYDKDARSFVQPAPARCIIGANVVRVGKDIVIDKGWMADYTYQNDWPEHRVQVVANGGHLDGCFAILKPGLILASHYWNEYEQTFPGWEIILLDNPTYHAGLKVVRRRPYPIHNGKFWNTAVGTNRSFNQHVIDHALDWVGMYTETYFELNCLVVDTENVVMLGENDNLARDLEKHGITVHWVPFRARSFWDGAMHCLTVDIRRQSQIEDFFPERN